jgi:hypothetical protein
MGVPVPIRKRIYVSALSGSSESVDRILPNFTEGDMKLMGTFSRKTPRDGTT